MMMMKQTTLVLLAFMLAGCVTVMDSRFTKKVDNEKAVETYVALGVGYLRNGNMPLARKKIERALEIDPESASAHSAMAAYWVERGEMKLAEKEFLIAYDLDDEHSPTNYHYGRFLFAVKNDPKGCEYIQRSAKDVDYTARVLAYENLGLCYDHFKQETLAMDAFEKAWSLDVNSTLSSLNLARMYLQRNRADIAQRWFNRFEATLRDRQLPHNAASLYTGAMLAKANRDQNAQASYAFKLKKRFPASDEYKRYRASQN
ncbi:type IV pilus biogenesis/stability protein PilW [Bermanella sp. WJH001]|uniref:type IV pilus biogenesis/stability protein PilW n=1 Tax=Bermanella sp. WJH001 TaxID=3048005 RepID=UPI0024BD90AB|nr:type IV pilus biogenesis/stability protein PilW [Bermanella sp. WJH001]MDJ1538179.1 type IV pilus biogenesis/stability protein PilW [Bermanella sp. WJH001]